MILTFTFCAVKHSDTALSDNKLLQIVAFVTVYVGCLDMNKLWGMASMNPATTSAYWIFIKTQYKDPNYTEWNSTVNNHYLWAYLLGPLVGAVFGGLLHNIHKKCVQKNGKGDGIVQDLLD